MEIDRNKLNEALNADPARLQLLASQIATAMGLPPEKAVALAKNSDLIKARLASMSESDLQSAANMLGPEKAAQIMAMLDGKDG